MDHHGSLGSCYQLRRPAILGVVWYFVYCTIVHEARALKSGLPEVLQDSATPNLSGQSTASDSNNDESIPEKSSNSSNSAGIQQSYWTQMDNNNVLRNGSRKSDRSNNSRFDPDAKRVVSIIVAPPLRKPANVSKTYSSQHKLSNKDEQDISRPLRTVLGDATNTLKSFLTPNNGIVFDGIFVDFASLCETGSPYIINGTLAYCSVRENGQCPRNHWCHIGSSRLTTFCCPQGKALPCFQELNVGYGSGQMARWYFDRTTQRCLQFRYRGYGGNENNFLTELNCESSCASIRTTTSAVAAAAATITTIAGAKFLATIAQTTTVFTPQPFVGSNQIGQQRTPETIASAFEKPFHGSAAQIPELGYSSNGQQPQSSNSNSQWINPASISSNSIQQLLPAAPQNIQWGQLQQPIYQHRQQQQLLMTTATTESPIFQVHPCLHDGAMYGTGQLSVQRYYYDFRKGKCYDFVWSGNGGNPNNFATMAECENKCRVGKALFFVANSTSYTVDDRSQSWTGNQWNQQQTSPELFHSNRPSPIAPLPLNPCALPFDQGQGNSPVQRWFYSQDALQCLPFTYLGQGGNVNNFISHYECVDACGTTAHGDTDACTQSQSIGSGIFSIPRWSFNEAMDQCVPFVYTGCCGNRNRFPRLDICLQMCQSSSISGAAVPGSNFDARSQQLPHFAQTQLSQLPQYLQGSGNVNGGDWRLNTAENNGVLSQTFNTNALTKYSLKEIFGVSQPFLHHQPPGTDNPCSIGEPAMHPGSTGPIFCSTSDLDSCPSGYYCHIGASSIETLCCRRSAANACLAPLATGSGSTVLSRWYFYSASSQCKAFSYTGIKGNENNFLTLMDCRQSCPEFDNPCFSGSPPFNPLTGQVMYCSSANSECPPEHWCHIGANMQTSVCCPYSVEDACVQMKVTGTGSNQLPRFYFDPTLRTCEQFIYSGKGGNQNSFVTKAECESACPVLDNPCADGGMPAIGANGSPVLCSTANPDVCPPMYFCHIGHSAATTLCCPGASDPCRVPLSRGSGSAVINRWYYNSDTKTCLSFSYSGRGGNQNNFISLAECRARCPEFQNPCSTGQPHIGLNGQISRCGATMPTVCPATYWCHVGSTLDSSVCCPGADNPCDLPVALGNGAANLLRFYYDRDMQVCRPFHYSGMGGNENSFLTMVDCESRCPVFKNPCANGDPARNAQGHLVPCSVSQMECPRDFYCHVGVDEQSTLCCPAGANPCSQPMQLGTGSSALPRHYFNSLTRQCLPFIYSGIGGSPNNFLSRADCEKSCPVFANPCGSGEPATGPNGQYILCTVTNPNVCPANYWCHLGDPAQHAVCCPGADNPCILPAATGHGSEMLQRWFFDPYIRKCSLFTYTGIGGNQNNFLTISDCQLRCREFQNPCSTGDPVQGSMQGGLVFCSSPLDGSCPTGSWCHVGNDADSSVCCPGASDPCLQSMMPGTGSSKLPRFYFNQYTRQCLSFTYTGRSGNQNNFLSEADCSRICPVFQNPCRSSLMGPTVYCSAQNRDVCPAGMFCHVGQTSDTTVCCPGGGDPCSLPVSPGNGQDDAPMSRWYYDSSERRCKQFVYSGAGGNQNNFLTQIECRQKCQEFTNPCFMGEPHREPVSGLVRFCNRNLPMDCPPSFFCHTGANSETTVCCPAANKEPCSQPLMVGTGPASLHRWFLNPTTKKCQAFSYSGIGGNQNNFLTQQECQGTCSEFNNPCAFGIPLTSVSGQITYCSAQNQMVCPVNHYCHVGVSAETSVCCPTTGDACTLPRTVGSGSFALQRWYFNSLTRVCEAFFYSGSGGNANNFLTLAECRGRCNEFNNPCIGQPYTAVGGEPLYCAAVGAPSNAGSLLHNCPLGYFCHYGDDSTTTMCCPVLGDACTQAVASGHGKAQLMRFYYNSATKSCSSFVYSGLGGNENNFRTYAECQARCTSASAVQIPFMTPPLLSSSNNNPYILNTKHRWSAVASGGSLGSIGGGQNRSSFASFQSKHCQHGPALLNSDDSVRNCDLSYDECPITYVCQLISLQGSAACCPDPKYFCLAPRDSGSASCAAASVQSIRYYFSPNTDQCIAFTYSGCQGNLNNFASKEDCIRTCASSPRQSFFYATERGHNEGLHESSEPNEPKVPKPVEKSSEKQIEQVESALLEDKSQKKHS